MSQKVVKIDNLNDYHDINLKYARNENLQNLPLNNYDFNFVRDIENKDQ